MPQVLATPADLSPERRVPGSGCSFGGGEAPSPITLLWLCLALAAMVVSRRR